MALESSPPEVRLHVAVRPDTFVGQHLEQVEVVVGCPKDVF